MTRNRFTFYPKPETKPVVNHGQIKIERKLDPTNPKRDTTVITIPGRITSRQKLDVEKILSGVATAHRKPGKGVQA